jgi:hypothetical protein
VEFLVVAEAWAEVKIFRLAQASTTGAIDAFGASQAKRARCAGPSPRCNHSARAVTPLAILSISSALLNSRSAVVPPVQWESKSRDRRKTAPITPTLESRLQADG